MGLHTHTYIWKDTCSFCMMHDAFGYDASVWQGEWYDAFGYVVKVFNSHTVAQVF